MQWYEMYGWFGCLYELREAAKRAFERLREGLPSKRESFWDIFLRKKTRYGKIAYSDVRNVYSGDWRSGSAGALQAQGQGFKSLIAHH